MTKSYENKLKECQIIWAKEKYTVLSKSQKIYLEIREYLKGDVVDFDYLTEKIDKVREMPESRKNSVNAFEHIWGYFKKFATVEEKDDFFDLLKKYSECKKEKRDIVNFIRVLLIKYPNDYLENSSFILEEQL